MQFLTFLKDSVGFVSDGRVSFFCALSFCVVFFCSVGFFSNQKAPSITSTALRFQSFDAKTVLQVT